MKVVEFYRDQASEVKDYALFLLQQSFTGDCTTAPVTVIIKSRTVDRQKQFVIKTLYDTELMQFIDYAVHLKERLIKTTLTAEKINELQKITSHRSDTRYLRQLIMSILDSEFMFTESECTIADIRDYYLDWVI